MELLFLLLLIPVFWLIMLPRRLVGAARRHRFALAGIVLLVLATGWLSVTYFTPPPNPVNYAQGDETLRAMLD
jgi:hypothetical protein